MNFQKLVSLRHMKGNSKSKVKISSEDTSKILFL